MLLGGCISVLIGTEKMPYDTLSYHFYNAYAFLNNRLNIDFCAAKVNTYLNPIIEIPYYIAVKYFNNFPKTIAFIFGMGYGIYLFILYKLFKLIIKNKNKNIENLIIFFSLFIAATGHIATVNIATTYHDMTVTSLFFIVIYIIFRYRNYTPLRTKYIYCLFGFAGVLSGIAVGIKLLYLIYFVAIIFSLLFFKMKYPYKTLLSILMGFCIGLFLYTGFWYSDIYTNFGNPVFPYWNNIFKSSYAPTVVLDKNFFQYPQNIFQTIFYPYWLLFNQKDGLRDLRLSFLYSAFIISLTMFFLVKGKVYRTLKIIKRYINIDYCKFLIIFCILSYLQWLILCPYSRYVLPIESLSGLFICLFIFTFLLIVRQPTLYSAILFLTALTLICTTKTSIEYRIPFNNKILYFEDAKIEDGATVLVTPVLQDYLSGVIPFQNPNARYVLHPSFNLDLTPITNISQVIKDDKLYVIADIPQNQSKEEAILESLTVDLKEKVFPIDCKILKSNINVQIAVCKLTEKRKK